MEAEPTVVVGRIVKAHGLTGEVAVELRSDTPDRFAPEALVYLEDGRGLRIRSSRPHAGGLLVSFEEVSNRDAAGALRGAMLVVPLTMLPDLPEGAWWPHELVGCEVVTLSGRALGTLADVVPNPANDLWVVRDTNGGELLIPALRHVLVEVDTAGRRIVVHDVPGLTAPEPPEES